MYLGYNDQKDTEIKTLESLKFEEGWQFLWIVNFSQDIVLRILLWLMN